MTDEASAGQLNKSSWSGGEPAAFGVSEKGYVLASRFIDRAKVFVSGKWRTRECRVQA